MKNILCYIMFFSLFLSGCAVSQKDGKISWFSPRDLMIVMPEDNSDYSVGFRQGCNTGVGIMGRGLLKIYGFEYDVKRALESEEYYAGFHQGMDVCVYAVDNTTI